LLLLWAKSHDKSQRAKKKKIKKWRSNGWNYLWLLMAPKYGMYEKLMRWWNYFPELY
jgi:hypothetical protein